MTVTKQRINSIIKEELTRARRMNEMMDGPYNDDLQSRHGRFTTPENVMGTPQHRAAHGPYVSDRRGVPSTPMGPASEEELERIRMKHGDILSNRPYIEHDGPNSPDSPYYGLREADDDMDTAGDDMDIDVVADDMGDDMGMPMSGEEVEPVAAEIDWSEFDPEDSDRAGAAFFNALAQLREENPDEEPTAEAVVALMQVLLDAEGDGDADAEADEEADDNAFSDDPAPLAEGVDWRRRAGLLAGITKRY